MLKDTFEGFTVGDHVTILREDVAGARGVIDWIDVAPTGSAIAKVMLLAGDTPAIIVKVPSQLQHEQEASAR